MHVHLHMRLACVVALCFVLVSLINAQDNNENDSCVACHSGWCVCDRDKNMLQCAWNPIRPIEWFKGCEHYEALTLYPEMPRKDKLFQPRLSPKKRLLDQQLLTGLDGLKQLIINRHCTIGNHAFAGLKNIETVEINWKSKAVFLKAADHDNKDRPVLFENSLADLPATTKLSGSANFVASVDPKKISYNCPLAIVKRSISAGQQLLYNRLEEITKQIEAEQKGSGRLGTDSRSDSKELRPSVLSERTSVDIPMDPRPRSLASVREKDATLFNDGYSRFHSAARGTDSGSSVDIQMDPRPRSLAFAREKDASLLLNDGYSRFHSAARRTDFGSTAPNAQLKRSLSVHESKCEDRAMLHSFADDTNKAEAAPDFRKYSDGTLGSAIVQAENPFDSQQLRNAISQPVAVMEDAASHVSSEDPAFTLGIPDLEAPSRSVQGNGVIPAVPYSESGKDGLSHYVELGQTHRPKADWLPLVPLGFVTELPYDISEILKAEYLFTDDVIQNVADPPKPSPVMGRYGRSVFVEQDNWIL